MFGEYSIPVYLVTGALVSVALASIFPPLTASVSGEQTFTEMEESVNREYDYCRQNMNGLNCACFAGRAAEVMMHQQDRIRGTVSHVDREDLARTQAAQAC